MSATVIWKKREEEQVLIQDDELENLNDVIELNGTSSTVHVDSHTDSDDTFAETEQLKLTDESQRDDGVESLSKGQPPRTPLFVFVVAFFSIIGGFLFGYDTGVIAGALLELEKDFDLNVTKKELVVSVTVVAAAIGAVIGGPFNEMLGRKKTIMISSIVFAVGAIMMWAAPTNRNVQSWSWLIVLGGRFIVGLGIGLASMTVPMYLAECSPPHLRGRLTVADNMAVTGGQFVAGVIDYGFSYVGHGWRFMLGIAALPAIVRFIAFFFLPESPRWLVGKGKVTKAKTVLEKLRGKQFGEERTQLELHQIQRDLEQSRKQNEKGSLHKLWLMITTRHLLLALVVGCGLQAIQQVSGINTVMYYSPTILKMAGIVDNHKAIGFGAVIAFGNFIFTLIGMFCIERYGRRILTLSSLTGVIASLSLLGGAFYLASVNSPMTTTRTPSIMNNSSECLIDDRCVWRNCDDCVIDDFCRFCVLNGTYSDSDAATLCVHVDSDFYNITNKMCQLPQYFNDHSCTAMIDSESVKNNAMSSRGREYTTPETYNHCPGRYSWLTLIALCFYIVSFSPGMGPVPWTVNAEIYPNWARSIGNSMSSTTNWVSNLLVSITFLHLARYLTRYGTFWLYTGIGILGWLFIFLLLPETKGRTLEQVEGLFQRPLCPPVGVSETKTSHCPYSKKAYYKVQKKR